MKERDIQAMSLKLIALHPKLHVFRIPDEVYLVLRLAAEGKPVSRGLAIKARGGLAAWPDELVFRQAEGVKYPVALIRENKAEKGRLSPKQKELYAELEKKGIPFSIPYTLDENTAETTAFATYEVPPRG